MSWTPYGGESHEPFIRQRQILVLLYRKQEKGISKQKQAFSHMFLILPKFKNA
jgi:hypothetical protein